MVVIVAELALVAAMDNVVETALLIARVVQVVKGVPDAETVGRRGNIWTLRILLRERMS